MLVSPLDTANCSSIIERHKTEFNRLWGFAGSAFRFGSWRTWVSIKIRPEPFGSKVAIRFCLHPLQIGTELIVALWYVVPSILFVAAIVSSDQNREDPPVWLGRLLPGLHDPLGLPKNSH